MVKDKLTGEPIPDRKYFVAGNPPRKRKKKPVNDRKSNRVTIRLTKAQGKVLKDYFDTESKALRALADKLIRCEIATGMGVIDHAMTLAGHILN